MFSSSTMSEPEGEIDERAVRHNIKKFLIIYFSTVIGAALVGGVIGAIFGHHHAHRVHHTNAAAAIAGIVIGLVCLGAGIATMYWVFHRRSYRRVLQYSWRRRFRVIRALRRNKSIAAEDRPVADALMYLNRNWRRNLLIIFPLAILFLVLEGLVHHGAARWLWLVYALVYVLLIPLALRNQHRIERNYHRLVRSGPPPAP